jgi:hypothetical protein
MPEEKSLPSWWATLPGIITALAALIKTYPSPGAPSFAPGWTSITLTADGLLFKNAATGATTLGEIDSSGNFRTK